MIYLSYLLFLITMNSIKMTSPCDRKEFSQQIKFTGHLTGHFIN